MHTAELWLASAMPLSQNEKNELLDFLQPLFGGELALSQLPAELATELPRLYLPLAAWLNQQRTADVPLVVGLNASQGSGKSTLCNALSCITNG